MYLFTEYMVMTIRPFEIGLQRLGKIPLIWFHSTSVASYLLILEYGQSSDSSPSQIREHY